jgi:hypothetical protein
MHETIQVLYREDPICDREERAIRFAPVPAAAAERSVWLADETARFERLEQTARPPSDLTAV